MGEARRKRKNRLTFLKSEVHPRFPAQEIMTKKKSERMRQTINSILVDPKLFFYCVQICNQL